MRVLASHYAPCYLHIVSNPHNDMKQHYWRNLDGNQLHFSMQVMWQYLKIWWQHVHP